MGRCDETYARHMRDRYDDLRDLVLFAKDTSVYRERRRAVGIASAARVAAGRAPAWPLIEDDDAAAHAEMLKLAEVADAPGARKMLMEKGGSRLAAFRCAATGRLQTVLEVVWCWKCRVLR